MLLLFFSVCFLSFASRVNIFNRHNFLFYLFIYLFYLFGLWVKYSCTCSWINANHERFKRKKVKGNTILYILVIIHVIIKRKRKTNSSFSILHWNSKNNFVNNDHIELVNQNVAQINFQLKFYTHFGTCSSSYPTIARWVIYNIFSIIYFIIFSIITYFSS